MCVCVPRGRKDNLAFEPILAHLSSKVKHQNQAVQAMIFVAVNSRKEAITILVMLFAPKVVKPAVQPNSMRISAMLRH